MTDLATLGLAIDSTPVSRASAELKDFSRSGSDAARSADTLQATAQRLGISVEEVRRRIEAANDNMERMAGQSQRLTDQTRQATVANDNLAKSNRSISDNVSDATKSSIEAGRNFAKTAMEIAKVAGYLKLAGSVAMAASPALKGFADRLGSGIGGAGSTVEKATKSAGASIAAMGPAAIKAGEALSGLGPIGAKAGAVVGGIAPAAVLAGTAIAGIGPAVKVASSTLTPFLKMADGVEMINLASKFGVAGAAAYALSPALREVANKEVLHGVQAIPSALGAATPILAKMLPLLGSALAFLSRLAVPIIVVVAAWKLLNAAVGQGAELLNKYGNEQRNLVSGVDERLKELTKFQDASLSAEQVRLATELGNRLNTAKTVISDFFNKQLDLNDSGLKMQNIWVRIVELVAAAVKKLNDVPSWAVSMMMGAATGAAVGSVIPGVGTVLGGVAGGVAGAVAYLSTTRKSASSEFPNPATKSLDEFRNESATIFSAAYERLKGGMGSQTNFANRFANIKEEEKEKKTASEAADAWDRATESIAKHSASLAADALSVGKTTAVQGQLRAEFQLLEAAKASDKGVTDEQIKQYTSLRATMTADMALKEAKIKLDVEDRNEFIRMTEQIKERAKALALAKVNDKINFGRQTALLSPEDVQIAGELRDIYPDVATALASVEAQGLRTNMALSNVSGVIANGLSTAIADVTNKTATFADAFKNLGLVVVQAIQNMIIKLMIVGPLMRALGIGGGGGLFSFLGFAQGGVLEGGKELGQGGIGHAAMGRVVDQGRFTAFAGGGIVSSPTLFPMANGTGLMGEAGPEAIMPLKRGPDGKLGVAGGGGGGAFVFSPTYNIDASGNSGMTKEDLKKVMEENNKIVMKDIKKTLPDQIAAFNADPRKR